MKEPKSHTPSRHSPAPVLAGTILFALVLVLLVRLLTAGAILRGTEEARQTVLESVAPVGLHSLLPAAL